MVRFVTYTNACSLAASGRHLRSPLVRFLSLSLFRLFVQFAFECEFIAPRCRSTHAGTCKFSFYATRLPPPSLKLLRRQLERGMGEGECTSK